ncbi:MAG: FAD-dependent monooxygenase [Rhodospirillaceae bacterium]|jgi:2-polyprenyl-6-methoxyphenol hydroxylase-like FAD-dependent oxidoreductase
MADVDTDVLIVGGGPVGLALAGDLGWRGINCLLVEQTDGIIRTPKMNEVNLRSMEFCRRWGIDQKVMDCPFPNDYPMDICFVTSIGGYELGRMPRPAKKDQKPGAASPVNLQICSQLWFDPILKEFAEGFDTVRLAHRHRLESFIDTGDGVKAEITNLETNETRTVHARYLVGCDGANSLIRETLGIGLSGDEVLGRPLHFYFKAPNMLNDLGRPAATFFLAFDKDGLWANIRIIDPENALWRLMVLDTPEDNDLDNLDQEGFLRRAVGQDLDVEWVGVSQWIRRGVVADAYSRGRVFLAGDAVHQLSPTGAMGMNTGIGDATDLAWKLTAVIDGWGGPNLLDSYDAERRPIGLRNVSMATEFHSNHLKFDDFAGIEDADEAGVALRERLGAELVQTIGQMFRTEGLQIGYRYEDSPICVPDGMPALPDAIEVCAPSARPGARAPHIFMQDGRSTLDLFGKSFVLLAFNSGDEPLSAAAAAQGLPLTVENIDEPAIREIYGADYVLVRPDGHVAWRGDQSPEDAAAVIDTVRGA